MKDNLSKMSRNISLFFGGVVEELGKRTKFVKRKSKLTAQIFSEALVMSSYTDSQISLEKLSRLIHLKGVMIKKQSLHERFTSEASVLMEAFFKESLRRFRVEKIGGIDLFKSFSGVKLLDSSSISLPESMRDVYAGFGGDASEAGLKLQTLFDYVEGQVEAVEIIAERKNDQSYKRYLEHIQKGALYLQDLGYFCLASFKEIERHGGYFISRYLPQTKIYDKAGEEIDLLKRLEASGRLLALSVQLGKEKKNKVPARLIATHLPEEEVKKRQNRIEKEARRKGRKPPEATLKLAKWSIYISNVPTSLLTDEQIHLVYTLRWQIELFFKLCKSEAGIHKINSQKSDRVQCEIYAKLIAVVLLLYLCAPIRWQEKQEISWRKAYQQLKQCGVEFLKSLKSSYRLFNFLKTFLEDLKNFALKDRYKKKKPATYQKLMQSAGQKALIYKTSTP